MGTNFGEVHVGCHCWVPLLGCHCWGAAGCHCWGAIAGCHYWGVIVLGAIVGCHCRMLATNFGGVHVGCHCWVPLLGCHCWGAAGCHCWGAIAGCHYWGVIVLGAIVGCHCRMLATNFGGVHVGCHCWVPLLGCHCWGAAGCHCWGAIAGCHYWGVIVLGAIVGCHCRMLATNFGGVHVGCHCWVPLLGCHFWVPLREKIDQSVTPFSAAPSFTLITHKLACAIWGLCWYNFFDGLKIHTKTWGDAPRTEKELATLFKLFSLNKVWSSDEFCRYCPTLPGLPRRQMGLQRREAATFP